MNEMKKKVLFYKTCQTIIIRKINGLDFLSMPCLSFHFGNAYSSVVKWGLVSLKVKLERLHTLNSKWNSKFFTFSLIKEGTTDEVFQFIMPQKSI